MLPSRFWRLTVTPRFRCGVRCAACAASNDRSSSVSTKPPKPAPPARDPFGNPLTEVAWTPATLKSSTPPAPTTSATDATHAVDIDQLLGLCIFSPRPSCCAHRSDNTDAITRLAPQRRAGARPAASRAAQLPAGTGHLFIRSFRGTVSWGQGHRRTDRAHQDSERLPDRGAAGDGDPL